MSDDLVTGWLEMMRACNRLTQSIERELAREHRLCVSAYELMSALVPATGWTRLVELTERVSRSQPQVSRLVAQMEAAGVLQRTASPDDGRGTQVRLTEAGRDLYAAATDRMRPDGPRARGHRTRPPGRGPSTALPFPTAGPPTLRITRAGRPAGRDRPRGPLT